MTETRIGPTEAKSREQREARVAANKKLIDKTTRVKAKGIGKVVNIKIAQRSGRPLNARVVTLRSIAGVAGTVRQGSDEGGCS
jgi:hypothetical protein